MNTMNEIKELKEFISAFNSAPEFIWNSENDNRKRLAESALETLINSNPGIFSIRCAINFLSSL